MGQDEAEQPGGSSEERVALGNALRDAREERGFSLDLLSHYGWRDGARLSASQIGQFERGEKRPRYKTLVAIIDGLGVSPYEAAPIIRLQLARAQLDPGAVGLREALQSLDAVESALFTDRSDLAEPAEELEGLAEVGEQPHSEDGGSSAEDESPPADGESRRRPSP